MIDLEKFPHYTGNLEQVEADAATLKKTASSLRTTGSDIHSTFQGLTSCYTAPEAAQLFHTTVPVRTGADSFATKLETVSGALSSFASTARPLVDRLQELRMEAVAFNKSIEHDDDWRKNQGKIDVNERLVHEIGTVWSAFQLAERAAGNKITALVPGGTHFVEDDGSHKPGMYGFNGKEAAKADKTPWGTVDKRQYEGLEAAWHWTADKTTSFAKGFFADGAWNTLVGLKNMVNLFDWDTFTETWKGVGDVFGGVSAYVRTPYDWAMDKAFGEEDHSDSDRQKEALREFSKSFVAWDEWGKNPTRAAGTITFNVLTLGAGPLLKLGRGGSVGKAGEIGEAGNMAKVAGALGNAGRLSDPMTYISKAVGFTAPKVADLVGGMNKLAGNAYSDLFNRAAGSKVPGHVEVTPQGLRYPNHEGLHRTITPAGKLLDEHGNPLKDTAPKKLPEQATSAPKVTAPDREPVLVGGGARETPTSTRAAHGGGHGAAASAQGAGHPTAHSNSSGQAPGGAGHHTSTSGTSSHGSSQAAHGTNHSTGSGNSQHGVPQQGGHQSTVDPAGHQDPTTDPHGPGSGNHHNPTSGHNSASDPATPSPHGGQLDPQFVEDRIKQLDDRQGGEGHAPGRHLRPDDEALMKRLGVPKIKPDGSLNVYPPDHQYAGLLRSKNNIDPLTGTTIDGVTGKPHFVGPFSTRFNLAQDMVRADAAFREYIRVHGRPPEDGIPIADILGPQGHRDLTGFYKNPANPSEHLPVDFENGSITGVYRKHGDAWHLHTMFPNPAVGRHP